MTTPLKPEEGKPSQKLVHDAGKSMFRRPSELMFTPAADEPQGPDKGEAAWSGGSNHRRVGGD